MSTFSVLTEYRPLKKALVCPPTLYYQMNPINHVEAHYLACDPPQREDLVRQHRVWTEKMGQLGVELVTLKPIRGLPHQLFTRDIGFAVGETLFVANMAKPIRQKETEVFRHWLVENKMDFQTIPKGTIEGGDVLIHSPYVFVGISQRTTLVAAKNLQKILGKEWKVVPLRLEKTILHLDCVMAIINSETMVWAPELILDRHEMLRETFPYRIEATRDQVFHMAVNMLVINPNNVIIEARHLKLKQELTEREICVHPIDWSEIKKLGGLFRCCTLPLA